MVEKIINTQTAGHIKEPGLSCVVGALVSYIIGYYHKHNMLAPTSNGNS